MTENAADRPLRNITRAELDKVQNSINALVCAYDEACCKNSAFMAIDWNNFGDAGYAKLTNSQKTLNNMLIFGGQVDNGGLAQLFTNFALDIKYIAAGVADFGWPELSDRFSVKFAEAFETPETAGLFASFLDDFQHAARHEPWEKAASIFHAARDHFDFNDFDTWWYAPSTVKEMGLRSQAFLKRREADLFEVSG